MADETLPRSASLIEAFWGEQTAKHPLQIFAHQLAEHHRRQWHAEDQSRGPDATASHKRQIDELNKRRVALVANVDAWIGGECRFDGKTLHTETLGSIVDRLAIAWVRANNAIETPAQQAAEQQLSELASAYDGLVDDLLAGARRLPDWRPLRMYRYQRNGARSETASEPVSVSLNGVDNIGKTTQLAWLHRGTAGAHLAGTIDAWDIRWRALAAGDFAEWWFETSTRSEHVELVVRSHLARRNGSGTVALEDRGLPMLRATCAATAAVKEGLSAAVALALVDDILGKLPVAQPRREIHVLLRRSPDPTREAMSALAREAGAVDERYAKYQALLAETLHIQARRGDYHVVIDIGDDPILAVQRRIRTALSRLSFRVSDLPDPGLKRLWVLAGLSESGKSTVGELLRDEHGVTRLKIGYMLEVAARRHGVVDPYQWTETEQAEYLSDELLRFGAAHKVRAISLESAHRFAATQHLKRVWGQPCRIVYLDAPEGVRVSRAGVPESDVRARDAIKIRRGAARIAGIADHILDNTRPLSALKLQVNELVCGDMGRPPLRVNTPTTSQQWLSQTVKFLVDDEVAVIMATGSTGTSHWRAGWSDLDLLVIRKTLPLGWLRTARSVPAPAGVRVAISTFTEHDVNALHVPPRVVHSLRRAASTGVLYRRAGYRMPLPASAHEDRTSRGELGLVLMTMRRLLSPDHPDLRAVYKHLVLLAKILLRADGMDTDFEAPEEFLSAFGARHGATGFAPPSLDELIARPADPSLQQQLIEAACWMLAYVDDIDRTMSTHIREQPIGTMP